MTAGVPISLGQQSWAVIALLQRREAQLVTAGEIVAIDTLLSDRAILARRVDLAA